MNQCNQEGSIQLVVELTINLWFTIDNHFNITLTKNQKHASSQKCVAPSFPFGAPFFFPFFWQFHPASFSSHLAQLPNLLIRAYARCLCVCLEMTSCALPSDSKRLDSIRPRRISSFSSSFSNRISISTTQNKWRISDSAQ